MKKVILIYGGKSAEHDISIMSSFAMLEHLVPRVPAVELVMINKAGDWVKGPTITEAPTHKEQLQLSYLHSENELGYEGKIIVPGDIYDKDAVIFPMLHGPNGEDGTIQGLFEVINMPYVGTGVMASACAMDKLMTKMILEHTNIPQLPYMSLTKSQYSTDKNEILQKILANLTFPIYVKPANMGSSVGISKVTSDSDLAKAIELAFDYDRRLVIEQGVTAREIEVAVLGNDDIHTTVPGEVVKDVDFYDFDAKYVDNNVKLQIPAQISEKLQKEVRNYAKEAYQTLDCTGLSRCDFFLTADGSVYLNEINTMPGFTPYSLYPLMWQEMGVSYGDLLMTLLELAQKRHQEKNKLK